MNLIFYLFIIFFEYCSCYEIIPITNFEQKFIILTPKKDYIIFKYSISGSSIPTSCYHQIKQYYLNTIQFLNIYLYKDSSKIQQNENGAFINYDNSYFMSPTFQTDFISISDLFYNIRTYFFVVKSSYIIEENMNFTLGFSTTEIFCNISNFIQAQITPSYGQKLNYKFHVPLEHKKYILYVNRGSFYADIKIIDNNKKIINENTSFYGSSYLELKDGFSYDIYFNYPKAESSSKGNIYFYFAQSKYTKLFPVQINTEYYYHFYTFLGLKLLLDLSSIKKDYKVWLEYNSNWAGKSYYKLYSYNTDDKEVLENTNGKKLTINDKEIYCYKDICKYYLLKDSDDIKMVVFDVQDFYEYGGTINLHFQYGNWERFITEGVHFSFIIGIGLSIPNFIIQAIMCSRNQKFLGQLKCTLFMDFIIHIVYGCLISFFSYIAGKTSMTIAYVFIGIYGFSLLINFILLCSEIPTMFIGIKCLLRKMKNFRTFNEAFNERRKIPPQITVTDNENNCQEYEYCSWEDNSYYFLRNDYKNNPILECKFNYEIKIDDTTREDLQSFKKSLEGNEIPTETPTGTPNETTTDDDSQPTKKYHENFVVPNFKNYETCLIKPTTAKDRFFVFLWFILLITGYMDILEIFICYEVEEIKVNLTKYVSNTKKYRNSYKLNDPRYEDNNIPNKNEIYETCETKDTKGEAFIDNNCNNIELS